MEYHTYLTKAVFTDMTSSQIVNVIYRNGTKYTGLFDQINWDSVLGYYFDKKDKLAPGHNPDRLSVDQVGEGYRLLDKDEITDDTARESFAQMWIYSGRTLCSRWSTSLYEGTDITKTYRTKLSRKQVMLLEEGYKPWFGDDNDTPPITGRVLYVMRDETKAYDDGGNYVSELRWKHLNTSSDIIAYKPLTDNTQPENIPLKSIPWDRTTCPKLGFEVIHKQTKDRYIVVAALTNSVCIPHYGVVVWKQLHEEFECTNGTPCGLLVQMNIK